LDEQMKGVQYGYLKWFGTGDGQVESFWDVEEVQKVADVVVHVRFVGAHRRDDDDFQLLAMELFHRTHFERAAIVDLDKVWQLLNLSLRSISKFRKSLKL